MNTIKGQAVIFNFDQEGGCQIAVIIVMDDDGTMIGSPVGAMPADACKALISAASAGGCKTTILPSEIEDDSLVALEWGQINIVKHWRNYATGIAASQVQNAIDAAAEMGLMPSMEIRLSEIDDLP